MRLYKPYKLSNFTTHYPVMANDYFQFKQFTIRQERCAMKVGTDGVLLGAVDWCNPCTTFACIGTGTGLIAIMAAQRNPELIIDAIEMIRQLLNRHGRTQTVHRGGNVSIFFKVKCKHLLPRINTTSLFATRLSLSILLKIRNSIAR